MYSWVVFDSHSVIKSPFPVNSGPIPFMGMDRVKQSHFIHSGSQTQSFNSSCESDHDFESAVFENHLLVLRILVMYLLLFWSLVCRWTHFHKNLVICLAGFILS